MAMRSPKWLVLAALVYAAPNTPGVIELWEDDELIFVHGTAGTLREALVHELLETGLPATHFSWEITYSPASRERELLAEYEAEHHRPPRLNA